MYFPIKISKTDDGFIGTCRDIPGYSMTGKTRQETEENVMDSMFAWLQVFYRKQKKPFPMPSEALDDEIRIYVDVKAQARMLMWNAFLESGISQTDFAKKMGFSRTYIANLFDFSKQSISVEAMESVMDALGYTFSLSAVKNN